MALEKELATYKSKFPELLAREGQFALVHKETVVETFHTYEDAIKSGYSKFALDPFLVKQIQSLEQVQFIPRLAGPRIF